MKFSLTAYFSCIGRGRQMAYMWIDKNRQVAIGKRIYNIFMCFLTYKMILQHVLIATSLYFVRYEERPKLAFIRCQKFQVHRQDQNQGT